VHNWRHPLHTRILHSINQVFLALMKERACVARV